MLVFGEKLEGVPEWRTIIVTATLVLVIVYLYQSVVSYRRLRNFKGPFLASFSLTWLAWKTVPGTLYLTLRDASEKYG
jgi:hypothetical protein